MGINGTYGMSHYSFAIVMNPVADISIFFPNMHRICGHLVSEYQAGVHRLAFLVYLVGCPDDRRPDGYICVRGWRRLLLIDI